MSATVPCRNGCERSEDDFTHSMSQGQHLSPAAGAPYSLEEVQLASESQ